MFGITGLIWYALIYLLCISGAMRNYPILFNKGIILYYCIAPCFYLYIRGSLNKNYEKFRKIDLLHFLPVIPAILSVLPYNLLSLDKQQAVLDYALSQPHYPLVNSPYIIGAWHWFLFPFLAIVYTFLQFRFTKLVNRGRTKEQRKNVKWVYLFTAICGMMFTGVLMLNCFLLFHINDISSILHLGRSVFFLCFCFLLLSTLFFINHEFLYGLVPMQRKQEELHEEVPVKVVVPLMEVPAVVKTSEIKLIDFKLIDQVESFISETEIFKKSGLTMSEFASAIEVPNHKLSELFNNHYNQNFNTYINTLRIEYVIRRLDQGDWKRYTLEAIASDAGFSSRNTFFTAFKKLKNTSPSVYLSRLKEMAA